MRNYGTIRLSRCAAGKKRGEKADFHFSWLVCPTVHMVKKRDQVKCSNKSVKYVARIRSVRNWHTTKGLWKRVKIYFTTFRSALLGRRTDIPFCSEEMVRIIKNEKNFPPQVRVPKCKSDLV